MEFPEGFVSASVWLDASHEPFRLRRRASHSFADFQVNLVWILGKRKGDIFSFSAIYDYKFGGKQIECGAKVVDNVAYHSAPTSGNGFFHLDPKEDLAGLAVIILNNAVGLACMKGFDLLFQVTEVCFGSFDLHPHPM